MSPDPNDKSVRSDVPPVPVVVRSSAGTGTGGAPLESQNLTTRDGQPNVALRVVHTSFVLAVRAVRVFLQTLVGGAAVLPVAGAVGVSPVALPDYAHQLAISATFAGAAAVASVLQNLLEVFTKLDQSHPELMG